MTVTRFAPSPTGFLHLGHAYAALHAAEPTRVGGRMLLRIEDIDRVRCRPHFTASIREDLAWLGLHWDEPVRTQSAHLDDYAAALADLRQRGLLYPCFCTRAEIAASIAAPHERPDVYPGLCRTLDPAHRLDRLARGDPHAWRLDTARALRSCRTPLAHRLATGETVVCRPERFGDVVLARKDVPASYHLCVTHDDALQGITLVTRGDDLREATEIHRLLQALMNWPTPDYRFHPVLRDKQGRRLAKRDGAQTLRSLRETGTKASELRQQLGFR